MVTGTGEHNHTTNNRKGKHVHADLEAKLAELRALIEQQPTPTPVPTPTPTPAPTPPSSGVAMQRVTFTAHMTDFENPGRGMEDSFEGRPGELVNEGLAGYPHSTFRRYWWVERDDAPLTTARVRGFAEDIDYWVSLGKLANARVAYVDGNDAHLQLPLSRIEQHIDQMLPVIAAKAYAFRTLEVGFLGPWGETHRVNGLVAGWHEETPSNGPQTQMLRTVQKIMAGTPSSLSVALRYPEVLMWLVSNGLSAEHAARLALFNDDFLSSNSDGTVALEGGTFPGAWGDGIDAARRAWVDEFGKTHPVRGESGVDNDPPGDGTWALQSDNALNHGFRRQHLDNLREWGLINIVLDPKGITAEVKRNLGYRPVLLTADIPKTASAGNIVEVAFEVENQGYAPPRRRHNAALLIGPQRIPLPTLDARQWKSGERTTFRASITVPAIAVGTHRLSLALPDAAPQLANDPCYAIRLASRDVANQDIWDDQTTGTNRLGSITIS